MNIYLKVNPYFAPILWRHDETLPTDTKDEYVGWNLTDTLVSSITIFFLFSALGYFLYTVCFNGSAHNVLKNTNRSSMSAYIQRCCQVRQRRRLSKMWEEAAEQTVHNVTQGE